MFVILCIFSVLTSFSLQQEANGTVWKDTEQVEGALIRVDIGPLGVWGVNKGNAIWTREGEKWKKVGNGNLMDISVGKAAVWGVNSKGEVYTRADSEDTPWTKILDKEDKELSVNQISVSDMDDANVWAVNKDGGVFVLEATEKKEQKNVKQIAGPPEKLAVVSVGQPGVWGVDPEGQVFYREGTYGGLTGDGTAWKQVEGAKLKWISSHFANEVYGTDAEGKIYKRDGVSHATPMGSGWKEVAVDQKMTQISVWEGKAWGVNTEDKIFTAERTYSF